MKGLREAKLVIGVTMKKRW